VGNFNFDFSGETAIITGGGRGIGKAIALGLAKSGADIVIADFQEDIAKETASEIEKMGRKCLAILTDVRNNDQVAEMVKQTIDAFGKIDILVNNAGVGFQAGVEKMSVRAWSAVIDINLTGIFLVSHHVGKPMIERKAGTIINISSVAGLRAFPWQAHYGASKAGVMNFTRSLATEWGQHNIRVNCIAPGSILTDMPLTLFSDHGITDRNEVMRLLGKGSALGRCGQPEDVANCALFLASNAASYISGATLVVDGCYELEPISSLSRPPLPEKE